jgi:preprotein translocase subunit SecE
MATDEEVEKKTEAEDEAEEAEPKDEARPEPEASAEESTEQEETAEEKSTKDEDAPMPTQLGHKRYVYAAYLAGGILVAFIANKIIDYAWYKLHDWKPEQLPEPMDEYVVALAAIVGVGVALYLWNRTRARPLAEEVAEELTKVTWPSRDEVTKGTTVVVITTIITTVFFALMDQFWLWVTKHVYGS